MRKGSPLADVKASAYPIAIQNTQAAIEPFRIEARFAEGGSTEDLDRALPQLAKEGVQALVVLPSGLFNAERQRILQFALPQRLLAGLGGVRQGLCSVTAPMFQPFSGALRIMAVEY